MRQPASPADIGDLDRERNHDAPYRRCRRRVGNRGHVIAYRGHDSRLATLAIRLLLIGGPAFCEACGSTGQIAKAGGPKRIAFMGETAADGDIVLCRCATPPRIIAVLSGNSWCDDEAETEGVVSSGSNPQRNTAASRGRMTTFAPSRRIAGLSVHHRNIGRACSLGSTRCHRIPAAFIRAMRARIHGLLGRRSAHD